MLAWRLGIAAILIPSLVALFMADHWGDERAFYLLGFTLFLAGRATWEMVQLVSIRIPNVSYWLTAVCSIAVVLTSWNWTGVDGDLQYAMLAFSVGVLLIFVKGAISFVEPGNSIETVATEIFIVVYIGVLLAITSQLRWVAGDEAGYLALGSLLIATKSGDIGAYTFGRLFGKRKMSPLLSPGKTWAGAVGAVVVASLASMAWFRWGTQIFESTWESPHGGWALLYGAILGVVGLIGDLCESLIKRDVGQKDSAKMLPGFGGMLDLLDSVLYAGPVAYVLWLVLPLATWQ